MIIYSNDAGQSDFWQTKPVYDDELSFFYDDHIDFDCVIESSRPRANSFHV